MLDNPQPSPQTADSGLPAELPPGLRPDGIQPQGDGLAPKPPAEPPATDPVGHVTLAEQFQYYVMYVGVLAGLWVVAYLVLTFVVRMGTRDALGFATVAALVGSFFTRSLLPQLGERTRPATAQPQQSVDSAREIIETVVFVVVLVLLLKSFTAEAFVIPTGSMAETLWGYQKVVECPKCKEEFPVNCSSEVDPSEGGKPVVVDRCVCPNCRQAITLVPVPRDQPLPGGDGVIRDPGWRSGDRVLVAKFVYDLLEKSPDRLDVVVFKFPGDHNFPRASGPVKRHVPINYIKRLIGLPEETIGIHRGKLWVLPPGKLPSPGRADTGKEELDSTNLDWQLKHTHHDGDYAKETREAFQRGEFEIVRKAPDKLLSMRRLVYDNDHQAVDLKGSDYERWQPAEKSGWSASGPTAFQHDGSDKGMGWLRYRHILRNQPKKPQLITDFMGYNNWSSSDPQGNVHNPPGENWVSDLQLECEVTIEKPEGTLALELSRGTERFQASFDLASGDCTLYRLGNDKKPTSLGTAKTRLHGKGTHQVRLANVDDRLTVWVDDRLPFGDGVAYKGSRTFVPTTENDLERPASIGANGAKVQVAKLKLFRDTYYTTARGDAPSKPDVNDFDPGDPKTWPNVERSPVSTYYVQPGHYLCLGDNSPESSDGRSWGLVPKRLMLGRALLVYYPFSRAGRIR